MQKLSTIKGKFAVYLILLLSAIALMFSLKQCSFPVEKNERYVRAGGDTINVAIEISPLSLSMSADTIGGFYYDILNLIAQKHDVKFKLHQFVPLDFALEKLNEGFFDVVVADIPSTVSLKQKYLLTEPLYVDHQVLIQRKEISSEAPKISKLHKLEHDSIWVVKNSPFIERISNLTDELGCDTIYVIESEDYSSEQLLILTALGDIKQAVVNANMATSMTEDYPQLDINTKISFNQFQVWVLRKDNENLCSRFNNWINSIKETEEFKQLESKYIKK